MNCNRQDDCDRSDGLLPEDRLRLIAEFWNELQTCGDFGMADQVVVGEISRKVADAMNQDYPDVDRAESLTFLALHLIAGNTDDLTTT